MLSTSIRIGSRCVVKPCRECGKPFEAATKRALYCSRPCKDRFRYNQHHPRTVRSCPVCRADITSKRRHAIYCSKSCKTRASDRKRSADGRNVARDRLRYQNEGERRRAYAREYLRRFPVKSKEFRLRRRARLRNAPTFRITERDWRRLVARYRGCAYCGANDKPLQRDHVTPLARGGHHRIGNILPACGPCNYSKRSRFLVEWRYGRPAAA